MKRLPKVAVLVPCYNEALTIGKVIEDFQKHMPQAQIYVYDNNSTDDTVRIALEKGAVVRQESHQGKGNVVRSMFRDIEADCYIMVDGDDTYPAQEAAKVAAFVLNGQADMAIGDRLSSTYFEENKRPFHNVGNRVVRALINLLFHSQVRDIMTGCRAFSRRFVKGFPVLSGGFEIETEMTIHALDKKMHIVETPIQYRDRIAGSESKLNTVFDGAKVIKTIFTLFKDYRPMLFFGWIAVLLFAAGMGLFLPILIEFLKTGLVPRFPTLILSVGFMIMALLSFVCGIILETIKKHEKRFYELTLNLLERKE